MNQNELPSHNKNSITYISNFLKIRFWKIFYNKIIKHLNGVNQRFMWLVDYKKEKKTSLRSLYYFLAIIFLIFYILPI